MKDRNKWFDDWRKALPPNIRRHCVAQTPTMEKWVIGSVVMMVDAQDVYLPAGGASIRISDALADLNDAVGCTDVA